MRSLRPRDDIEDEDCLLLTEGTVREVSRMGALNWRGLWTLMAKETIRYLKIWPQTILSPLIMTYLFYSVFVVSNGIGVPRTVGGIPFLHFIIPGLVMMSMAQSAFISPAVALILSKLQGNIVDILMTPVSAVDLTVAYSISGMLRGVIVGLVTMGGFLMLTDMPVHSVTWAVFFAVAGSLMLSLLGLITGILGDKFDHLGAMQNFIIMPATFLSGTFYSVTQLPVEWRFVCFANPFFYMIDGFRYAFTGRGDAMPLAGAALLVMVSLVLLSITYWLFAKGTRLKA